MIPKPGIYYDISFDEYKSWECVNNSALKVLSNQSPAHCKYYMDNGREDTPALKLGRAVDAYILEPERFVYQYLVEPECDKRTKDGKITYNEFLSRCGEGIETLTEKDMAKIIAISSAVMDSQATRLIRGGKAQVCIVWVDEPTGLLCKMRMDYLNTTIPMITDLKTTQDCSPFGFARDMAKYSYHQQAGFYCMGYEALTGERPQFAIFAIEKEPPYVHSAYEIDEPTILAGTNAARNSLTIYADCVKNNHWPQYSDKITLLNVPTWALQKNGVHEFMME